MMFYLRINFRGRQEITPSLRAQATTLLRAVLDDAYLGVAGFGEFTIIREGFELEGNGRAEIEAEFDIYPDHSTMKTYLRDLVQGKPLDGDVRVWSRDPDGEVLSVSRVGNVLTWTEHDMPQLPTISTEG